MKTQPNILTRTLGGLAAASVLLAFAGTASAQTVIDFNSSDNGPTNATETGFTGQSISSNNGNVTQPVELTLTASFGIGGTYDVTFREATFSGSGVESRSRSGTGFVDEDLLRDFWKAEFPNNELFLEFDGLQAGQYTITTWHNDPQFGNGQTTNLAVTDANRTDVSIGSTTQVGGASGGFTNVAMFNFDFEANGTDTVTLEFFAPGGNAAINGFELAVIPEPGTSAVIAGVLVLGVVMWRRRRG
jgi:hypothetical protein